MNEIEQLRLQITKVDSDIIELIAKRQDLAKKIGQYKKKK
jgi:chorismate mutase